MFKKVLGLARKYWLGVLALNGVMLFLGLAVIVHAFNGNLALKVIASWLSAFLAFGDVMLLLSLWQNMKQRSRLLQNTYLKLLISTHIGLVYNICYLVFAISLGFLAKSSWYFIYALYHLVFAVSKSAIARTLQNDNRPILFWQMYRRLGYCLILSAVIFHLLVIFVTSGRDNLHTQHPFMVYLMALMTFINLISSSVTLFSKKGRQVLQLRAGRPIHFAASLFSLFFLQTMLLRLYGKDELDFQRLMTIILGTSIFLILMILGIAMISIAYQQTKSMQKTEA
ncbi:beta-carotene 15,15'-monooxygenase [Streptococcus hyointestinalis]|uniref:Membrane protein n=1 Tax=Streptococcus hyointestinalis TaxID=1337 RepID=A0A380K8B5_9STRE|nr:beta-carotene 15,15'-monooxygenase [Streptococcus hyointestinalis]SUN60376.1 membrane protein [Streptococcus hyointestinalis]